MIRTKNSQFRKSFHAEALRDARQASQAAIVAPQLVI